MRELERLKKSLEQTISIDSPARISEYWAGYDECAAEAIEVLDDVLKGNPKASDEWEKIIELEILKEDLEKTLSVGPPTYLSDYISDYWAGYDECASTVLEVLDDVLKGNPKASDKRGEVPAAKRLYLGEVSIDYGQSLVKELAGADLLSGLDCVSAKWCRVWVMPGKNQSQEFVASTIFSVTSNVAPCF